MKIILDSNLLNGNIPQIFASAREQMLFQLKGKAAVPSASDQSQKLIFTEKAPSHNPFVLQVFHDEAILVLSRFILVNFRFFPCIFHLFKGLSFRLRNKLPNKDS